MSNIIRRRTDALLSKVDFTYNKPVSSSDLNESQSVLLENFIKYYYGSITSNRLIMNVTSYSGNSTSGLTLKSFKYLLRSTDNDYFYGSVVKDINIGINGSTSSDQFQLYAYFRVVELNENSEVYSKGIRSNPSQYGLTEELTTNNIFDDLLGEAVSSRRALELTFFLKKQEDSEAPTLSGWSSPVLVANVTLSSSSADLVNINLDLDQKISRLDSIKSNIGHTHTPSEVGLSNVKNYTIATKAEAEAGTSNSRYMTPLRVKEAIELLAPPPTWDSILDKPSSFPASMITQNSSNRFVTDAQISSWNAKWDYNESTIKGVKVNKATDADTVNGKTVAVNVPANAKFTDTVYTHPTSPGYKHIPSGGSSGQVLKYSSDGTAIWATEKDTITTINGKTGAISKADIVALGIPAQDTVYSLPTASSSVLGGIKVGSRLSISNGVLSADSQTDNNFTNALKTKLDGIATGANNYTHPSTHPASMITGLHASATTGVAGSVAWGNVTGKPSTFTPSSHTHDYLPLTGGTLTGEVNMSSQNRIMLGGKFYIRHNSAQNALEIGVVS